MPRTRRLAVLTGSALAGSVALAVAMVLGLSVAPDPAVAATTAVTSSTVRTAAAATVYGSGQYLDPNGAAAQAAAALRSSDPAAAAAARTIAGYPIATWLGEWSTGSSLVSTLRTETAGAAAAGTTAVFVTYAVPDRDCGGYSAGGMDETTYDSWVDTIASTLAGTRSVVLVEPDSLAELSDSVCSSDVAAQRYRILSREVAAFTAAGVPSYLDGGDSNWVTPATMASRLQQAGVGTARGFFSNVADYYPTSQEQAYDQQISALTGGAHYVIDTSRNGQGWKGTWCNAPGAGLGTTPRVVSDGTALDALLWVKTPGASDGSCDGAPAAGDWYPAYAEALVAHAELGTPVTSGGGSSPGSTTTASGSGTTGSGSGTTGSGTPTATGSSPSGSFDTATAVAGGVAVTGWAFDRDALSSAVAIRATVGGTSTTITANASRPDVARAFGAGVGTMHGFAATVHAAVGSRAVCLTAVNVGGGADTSLGCRTVTVPDTSPSGSFDTATGMVRRIALRGWAFDRDALSSAVRIRATIGGTSTMVTADASRPDVDRAFGVGTMHGFSATVHATRGTRTVCLTAVNVGNGADTSLGCRTVTVR